MKWIHQLHYTFPAGLSHDKWHKLNVKNDTANGLPIICQLAMCGAPGVWRHIRICTSKTMTMHNSTSFRYIGGSLGSVMSLMTSGQTQYISQSHLAIMSGNTIFSCCVGIHNTGSQDHWSVAAFASIRSKLRRTGESSACVLSHVTKSLVQPFWQSPFGPETLKAIVSILVNYGTLLSYLWQSRRICWHLIEILVYQRILTICLELHYDSYRTVHLQIPFSTDTLGEMQYLGQNMRNVSLIRGKASALAGIWSQFRCTGMAWVYFLITDWLLHIC